MGGRRGPVELFRSVRIPGLAGSIESASQSSRTLLQYLVLAPVGREAWKSLFRHRKARE